MKVKNSIEIYVDADACPVKEEVLRVANRHKLKVFMVSNSWLRIGNNNLKQLKEIIRKFEVLFQLWILGRLPCG